MSLLSIRTRLKAFIALLLSYIPTPLPTTPQGIESFTDSILELGGWDQANISFRNAIVTQILHVPMGTNNVPKQFFIKTIRRSITNQLAYARMNDYKQQEKQVNETVKEAN